MTNAIEQQNSFVVYEARIFRFFGEALNKRSTSFQKFVLIMLSVKTCIHIIYLYILNIGPQGPGLIIFFQEDTMHRALGTEHEEEDACAGPQGPDMY